MVLEDENVTREDENVAEKIIGQFHNMTWLKRSTTDSTREGTEDSALWNGTTRDAKNKNSQPPKETKSLAMDNQNIADANPAVNVSKENVWKTEINTAESLFPNANSEVNIILSEEEQVMLAVEESLQIAEAEKEITKALNEESNVQVEEAKETFIDECSWDNVRKNLPPVDDEENHQIFDVNNNGFVEEASNSRTNDDDKAVSKGRCITARTDNDEDKIQEIENAAKSVVESPEPAIKPINIDKYGRIDGLNERRMFMGLGARKKEQIYMNQQLARNALPANKAQHFQEQNANKVDSNRKMNKNANYSQGRPVTNNSYEKGSTTIPKEGNSMNYSLPGSNKDPYGSTNQKFSREFRGVAKDRGNRHESLKEKASQEGNVPKLERLSKVTTKSESRTPMGNRVVEKTMMKEVECGVQNIRKNMKDSDGFCPDKPVSKLPSLMDFKSRFNSPQVEDDRSMPAFPPEVTSDTMKFDPNSMKIYYGDPNVNDFQTIEVPECASASYSTPLQLPNMKYPPPGMCISCHKTQEKPYPQRNEPSLYRLLMEKKARDCCSHTANCLNSTKFQAQPYRPEVNASNMNFTKSEGQTWNCQQELDNYQMIPAMLQRPTMMHTKTSDNCFDKVQMSSEAFHENSLRSPTHTILVVDNSGNIVNTTHIISNQNYLSQTAQLPINYQQLISGSPTHSPALEKVLMDSPRIQPQPFKDVSASYPITADLPGNLSQHVTHPRYEEAAANMRQFIDTTPFVTDIPNQGNFDKSIEKSGQYPVISQRSGQYGTGNIGNILPFLPNQETLNPNQTMNSALNDPARYNRNFEVTRCIMENNCSLRRVNNLQVPSVPRGRGRLQKNG